MSVSRLEPPDAPVPAGPIAGDLDRRIARVAGAARRVRRQEDGEAIHDLRVAIRRLDARLDLWRDTLATKPARRARRDLKALRRAVGPARTLEVTLETLDRFLVDAEEPVREGAGGYRARLVRRVAKARARAAKAAARRTVGDILERLSAARETGATPAAEAVATARTRVERLDQRAHTRIADALEAPAGGALHDARIATRRWRYASETLAVVAREPHATLAFIEAQREAGETLELEALEAGLMDAARRAAKRERTDEAAVLEALAERVRRQAAERRAAWTSIVRPWTGPRAFSRPSGS